MATSRAARGVPSLRSRIITAAVVVVLFLLVTAPATAQFYTNVLWFRDLGQNQVFWTRIWSTLSVGLIFGALSFAIVYANLVVARRMRPPVRATATYLPGVMQTPQQQFEETLAQVRAKIDPFVGWVLLAIAALVAISIGSGMSSSWETFRLALGGVAFGKVDPQFHLDIGFFVFKLPALRMISDWLFSTLVLTLVLTLLVHLFEGGIRPTERWRGIDAHVKAHVSVLLGLIVASKAFDYWLSIYELDFSPRGQVLGASYTDVHAQIPAYIILIVIALAMGLLLIVNLRYRGWKIPLIGLGVWIVASVLVGSVYPAIVQQLEVAPNELAFETPYIQRNISSTRDAFDLSSIDATSFAAATDLTAADIVDATSTVKNARLWDPNVVVDCYKQLQEMRFYYDFHDVDIDRYTIDGTEQQVLVSVREMNTSQLSATAKTWINEHLVYTHGYGAVVSPVNQVSPDGLPTFIIQDLPPKSSTDLQDHRPRHLLRRGDRATTRSSTRSRRSSTTPSAGPTRRPRTKATTASRSDRCTNRLAFAITTGDVEILFADAITDQSRMLYRRIDHRPRAGLAPWLQLDKDPYPAIVDGRIVWVLDGYTTSSDYPYSQTDVAAASTTSATR